MWTARFMDVVSSWLQNVHLVDRKATSLDEYVRKQADTCCLFVAVGRLVYYNAPVNGGAFLARGRGGQR